MNAIPIHRHEVTLVPDSARVIIRPFIPGEERLILTVIGRALSLSDEEVTCELAAMRREFEDRHYDINLILMDHFRKIEHHVFTQRPLSLERQLLMGALFSGEYALESAAIFNPSMVPHPDQSNLPEGAQRFIMSLRAVGEGHISSIEFRAGIISGDDRIKLDPVSRFVTAPEIIPDPKYQKRRFRIKLHEMGCNGDYASAVLNPLGDTFTRSDLNTSIGTIRHENQPVSHELKHTLESIDWLADSNYEVLFSKKLAISERIIFPVSPNETNGIEDARFVRFVDDDDTVTYYATYTGYNGHDILPQLLETTDFLHFRILTLNGNAVQNKGMALFPRRIGGRYAMLSRQDNENLFIMFSDSPHHWNDPQVIFRPSAMWESVKVGNCGSPIETEEGWVVITHGVGPMRKYCIGAVLLDIDDPTKVIGRLSQPLLRPEGNEREGYVPNVVYSCGSMLHGEKLILPFAVSDHSSSVASLLLDDLLKALLANAPPVHCEME